MADRFPLVIESGRQKRLQAADALVVHSAIDVAAAGALALGTSTATSITLGSGGAGGVMTTVAGDLTVTGNEVVNGTTTFNGATIQFGDAATDIVTMKGRWGDATDPDLIFALDLDHTIGIDASADDTAGHSLTVNSSAGGAAVGAAGGAGGTLVVGAGAGGAGAAAQVAGAGGVTAITGGAAGADGGGGGANGGGVTIDAGAATGAGTDGSISIGSTNAAGIALGNATDNTTITQTGTGLVTLTGNVDAGAGVDVTGLLSVAGALTQTTAGQVSFAGNVDAAAGVDVTGDISVTGVIQGPNDGTGIVLGTASSGANTGSVAQFVNMTTAERDNTVGADGMIIYNTTTNQFEGFDTAWGPLAATTAISGTDNISFDVNQDGVLGSDEDPYLILTGGDGAELINTMLTQDSSADSTYLTTSLASVTDGQTDRGTSLTLGAVTQMSSTGIDADATFVLRGHKAFAGIAEFTEVTSFLDSSVPTWTTSANVSTTVNAGDDGVEFISTAGQGGPNNIGGAGDGGNQTITAGLGGTGTGAQAPGDGGGVSITAGNGGTGGSGVSNGGSVTIAAGTGVGAGTTGNINMGTGSSAANINVGTDAVSYNTINGAETTVATGHFLFTGQRFWLDPTSSYQLTMDAGQAVTTTMGTGAGSSYSIALADNIADPYSIAEAGNEYIGIVTTDANEALNLGNSISVVNNIVQDDIANAFTVKEAGNSYIDLNTRNGIEELSFGNATTNSDVSFLGTGDIVASNGTLDVPAGTSFKVGTTALTTANFTAANLDTLLDGSNADALHTHASGVSVTAGEAVVQGNVISLENNGGSPEAFLADANGAGNRVEVLGIASASAASAATFSIVQSGEVAVADAEWDVVPAVADVGSPVYMSTTAGNLTLTAPSASGETSCQVGNVSVGGAGAVKIIVGIRQATIL